MTATVRRVIHNEPALLAELAFLLLDVVRGGASVGFLDSLTEEEAQQYWQQVMQSLGEGLQCWVAENDGHIVGTVQLALCLKPNARHRAEIQKLQVLRSAQGRGIASKLMQTAESHARDIGCTLLFLDTQTGSKAEAVYRHLNWSKSGDIPDYASLPNGERCSTSIYFKQINITDGVSYV